MLELSFEQWLYLQGRHKNTVALHLKKLKVIDKKVNPLNLSNFNAFLADLKARNYKHATLNHYICTIKLYGRYLNTSEFEDIKLFSKTPTFKGTLSDSEVEDLINLPPPAKADKASWELFSLYLEVLAYTGCRPGEAAALRVRDLDFGRDVIIFEYTKTGKMRQIKMAPLLEKHLKKHAIKVSDYLFVTKRGKVFSDHNWLHSFNKRKKLLNINRPGITLYSFRHSFATRMLERDLNIHKLAKILGHDIKMTQVYEHLTVEDIKVAMAKHPLIAKQLKYTKGEIEKLLSDYLNGLNISYNIATKNNSLTLYIECPN